MNAEPDCPHLDTMRELARAGHSTPGGLEMLAEHLETCRVCVTRLEAHLRDAGIAQALRSQGSVTATLPPVEEMAQRLVGLTPLDAETPDEVSLDFLGPPRAGGERGWLGPYRVRAVLGRGGMGVVLLADAPDLDRPVALKVLRPDLARVHEARERFRREARALASLPHPHIVAVHHADLSGPVPYLVMERLEGRSLARLLEQGERLPRADVVRLGRQVALALAAVHQAGIVHRDLKPANVFLARPATPGEGPFTARLLDFGLARAEVGTQLTQSGMFLGTPAYAAPEQLGDAPLDHRADLFALGAILYRLLADRPAFPGERVLAVLRSLATHTPTPLRDLDPTTPPDLSALVEQLLAREPRDRPASALEVAQRLAALEQQPPSPPARRRWRTAALLAPLAALLLGGIIWVNTAEGTLQIDSEDPAVKVLVEDAGGKVTFVDGKRTLTVRLRPGAFRVELLPGQGLELDAQEFTLRRGEKTILRVRRAALPPLAGAPPDEEKWLARVRRLPAERQVAEVAARMKARLEPETKDGQVVAVKVSADEVADLTPLRAFSSLRVLVCRGSAPGKGKVRDLSPLAGLPLTRLDVSNTAVETLAPLAKSKVDDLRFSNTRVADLGPLATVPLFILHLDGTHVRDLSPLRDCRGLRTLIIADTLVRDLSPLKPIPLSQIDCTGSLVRDVSVFRGSGLGRIYLAGTAVRDLSPLRDCKVLTTLVLDHDHPDLERVRGLPALVTINNLPVKRFWQEVDAARKGGK